MNLIKKEKKFWQRRFRIGKLEEISPEWTTFKAIDSNEDDDFFYFLSLRVTSILEIHLKDTLVTDEGVKYISQFKKLHTLYLRSHPHLTKASIPYFNQMPHLQSLNITNTGITLNDVCQHLDNPSLKEVFVSSEETDEKMHEMVLLMKEKMPNCNIYLNTSFPT